MQFKVGDRVSYTYLTGDSYNGYYNIITKTMAATVMEISSHWIMVKGKTGSTWHAASTDLTPLSPVMEELYDL